MTGFVIGYHFYLNTPPVLEQKRHIVADVFRMAAKDFVSGIKLKALHGQPITVTRTCGEDNLFGFRTDQRSNLSINREVLFGILVV